MSKSSSANRPRHIEVGVALIVRPAKPTSGQSANKMGSSPASVDGQIDDRPDVARRAHEVLVTRRRSDTIYGGWWEFPGGKIEAGESPEACVVREVFEEVGLAVTVRARLGSVEHTYEHGTVRLHIHLCQPDDVHAEPRAIEVAEARWSTLERLDDIELLPANGAIVQMLREALSTHASEQNS